MTYSIERPIRRFIKRPAIRSLTPELYGDDAENLPRLDRWHLVKGTRRRYNVPTKLTEPRTGWALHEPSDGFTISPAGTISANLPHLYTNPPRQLRVITDQGDLLVPITMRDWFPGADFDYAPANFFSIARAHNSAAAQTLFAIEVLDPNDGRTLLSETDAQSDAEGYLDETALQITLSDITDGIIVVNRIRDQISGNWVENSGNRGTLGYVQNGVVNIHRSAGQRPAIIGRWNAADFNSSWASSVSSPDFDYGTSTIDLADNYILMLVIRNREGYSDNRLAFGDSNRFPAIKHNDTPFTNYYLNNDDDDSVIQISFSVSEDWKLWEAFSLQTDATQYRKGIRYFDLQRQHSLADNSGPDDGHHGDGLRLLGEKFEFCEWAIFRVNDHIEGNAYRTGNFRRTYARNAAAIFGGQHILY